MKCGFEREMSHQVCDEQLCCLRYCDYGFLADVFYIIIKFHNFPDATLKKERDMTRYLIFDVSHQ